MAVRTLAPERLLVVEIPTRATRAVEASKRGGADGAADADGGAGASAGGGARATGAAGSGAGSAALGAPCGGLASFTGPGEIAGLLGAARAMGRAALGWGAALGAP